MSDDFVTLTASGKDKYGDTVYATMTCSQLSYKLHSNAQVRVVQSWLVEDHPSVTDILVEVTGL